MERREILALRVPGLQPGVPVPGLSSGVRIDQAGAIHMNILKKVGVGLIGLVVVVVAAAYILPRQIEVERSVIIAAEPDEIFPHLNSLKAFNAWSPWADLDPDTVYVFSGPETGKGARSDWSSENPAVGSGSQEITESELNKSIRTRLDFGPDGTADGFYELTRVETGTLVTWGFGTDMGNSPVGRYVGLMMDKWVGADFEKGLNRLKALVEEGEI